MSKKIQSLMLSLMLFSLLLLGAGASAEIAVTDRAGRSIVLDAPPARIVALTPADCEILYALGAGDALVGRGEYCNFPQEVEALPAVLSGANANIEQMLALDAQLVLMGTGFDTLAQAQQLEDVGVCAVVTGADSIEETYDSIRLLGALTGRKAEAEKLIGDMQSAFDDVASRERQGGKRVYFEISPLQYGLYTAGSGTFMDELAALCGAENVFADALGWASVSEEQVLLRDPDVILTTTMHYGVGPMPEEEICSRESWADMKAVQAGQVHAIDSDMFSRPGPRLAQAADTLWNILYGEDGK